MFQEGIIALNKAISTYSEENGVLFYTYASICIERHLITFCKRIDNKKENGEEYKLFVCLCEKDINETVKYILNDDKNNFHKRNADSKVCISFL